MSAKTNRQAQKDATRVALKNASRRCFNKGGYAQTGIGDIAKEAGVAHGTFYVHFDSKEAALDELLRDYTAALSDKLAPVVAEAGGASLEATVAAAAAIVLDDWKKQKKFIRCYAERAGAGLGADSLHSGVNPPAVALLHGALEALAQARGVKGLAWDLVTHGLLALWLRVGLRYLFGPKISRAKAIQTLVAMTVGSVETLLEEGAS